MNALTICFILATVAIELLPLVVVRKVQMPEKAKITRFFVTLAVAALVLLFAVTLTPFGSSLGRCLWIIGLLAFYGTFPFTRWLTDALGHLPRQFMLAHFLLINAAPWLLAMSAQTPSGFSGTLRVVSLVHMIVLMLRMVTTRDVAMKYRHAIVLLNGMLAGLVHARQVLPFAIIICSECLLLWSIPKDENS
ncbi:MAG: hypothetical protein LBF26_00710 [Puniceicoccales bacterium]|jgi:hypothetical protein|nr:hypothetical protein [Puniceicoccales bacterium]